MTISPEEFMQLSLPERFKLFMLEEMCDEATYLKMMQANHNNYLAILGKLKQDMPDLFYMYFNDLLFDEEREEYNKAFCQSIDNFLKT